LSNWSYIVNVECIDIRHSTNDIVSSSNIKAVGEEAVGEEVT